MFIRERECEPTKKFQRRGRNRKGDREQLSPLGRCFSSPVQHALSLHLKHSDSIRKRIPLSDLKKTKTLMTKYLARDLPFPKPSITNLFLEHYKWSRLKNRRVVKETDDDGASRLSVMHQQVNKGLLPFFSSIVL